MSYDIDVYSERPHPDCKVWHETVEDYNLTYNVAPALQALGVSLSEFREGPLDDLATLCAAALTCLNTEGEKKFAHLVRGCGSWGSIATVRHFLEWVIDINKNRPGSYALIH